MLGATVTVALDNDLAGVAPIYRGRLLPVGQIGSLVRIPQGLVDLIGTVTLVGIAELSGAPKPSETVQKDERWLQIQLVGEIDIPSQTFRRGIGNYPGMDDSVHFATPEELRSIFPGAGAGHVRVGALGTSSTVPVCVDAAKLVVRHAAIVGSTGAGKTSAVAALVQGLVRGGWTNANIVVIDPHGEYAAAFGPEASVRSVLGKGDGQLRVPYWAFPAAEILRMFIGAPGGATLLGKFSELVAMRRKEFVKTAKWVGIDVLAVTADTPVPFDLHAVWHDMDYENNETRMTKDDPSTVCKDADGDPKSLRSTKFKPYGPSSKPPHKANTFGSYGNSPELLRRGLRDPRLEFLLDDVQVAAASDPLSARIPQWLGGNKPVSVMDFSGVPARVADVAIGLVLGLLFEIVVRSGDGANGVGRQNPILIVLEEAHRYVGEDADPNTKAAVNRIAREGRKYGIGLLLVSQRPTELPKTALSQCGTMIAMRLASGDDQNAIRACLPDNVAGLAAVLPSLRTHEAIIAGEAVALPVRAILDPPNPWPHAQDPSLAAWRRDAAVPQIDAALRKWRDAYA